MEYVDLHCHWVFGIDDGARTADESRAMLVQLKALGFGHVVATPHMRPGMFDNTHTQLRQAFRRARQALLPFSEELPQLSLASEHFFEVSVVDALLAGHGLPYAADEEVAETGVRKSGAFLIEFGDLAPLSIIENQLYRLRLAGLLPVIAHPERYRAVWADSALVGRLQDLGCVALLDAAALVGKYGRRSQDTARTLLEQGVYFAACSDIHRPQDTEAVAVAMDYIRSEYGQEEVELLFAHGPRALLAGHRPPNM